MFYKKLRFEMRERERLNNWAAGREEKEASGDWQAAPHSKTVVLKLQGLKEIVSEAPPIEEKDKDLIA